MLCVNSVDYVLLCALFFIMGLIYFTHCDSNHEMWFLLTVVQRWSKTPTTTTRGRTSLIMDSATTTHQTEVTPWGTSLTTGLVLKPTIIIQALWPQLLVFLSPCPETAPQTSLWSCQLAMKRKPGAMGGTSKTWTAGGAVEVPITTTTTTWEDRWLKPWDLPRPLPQPVFSISSVFQRKPFIEQCKTNTTLLIFLLFCFWFLFKSFFTSAVPLYL